MSINKRKGNKIETENIHTTANHNGPIEIIKQIRQKQSLVHIITLWLKNDLLLVELHIHRA